MTRAYVSGPMTGYPDFNRRAFDTARRVLHPLLGAYTDIVDPVAEDIRVYGSWEAAITHPWQEHLKRDLETVTTCDMIVMLAGWEDSKGARLEYHVAQVFGLPAYFLYDTATGWKMDGIPDGYVPSVIETTGPPPLSETEYSRNVIDSSLSPSYTRGEQEEDDEIAAANARFEFFEDNPLRQIYADGGVKDNVGKPRVDLLPSKPLIAVGRVLAFGARKYKPHNWRLGLAWSDTLASAMRHQLAFADGEDIDLESGECHVDNAICQLMFLSEYYHTKTGTDDRWKGKDGGDVEAAATVEAGRG